VGVPAPDLAEFTESRQRDLKPPLSPAVGKCSGGALALLVWLAICSVAASAQTLSELARDVNPLFQRLIASPAEIDNAVKYAVGTAQAGDIESAISVREQLLFYNPGMASVRFELGVLYYRLGSYAMARGYFQTALESPDISPALRQNCERFIIAINKKLQPDQLSGFAQTGLRYQTNVSAGPGQQALLASGRTFDSRFLAKPGWNWFGAFGVNYSHDFENQRGDTFEASAVGYDAQQFRAHQFDVGLLELRAGPRFGLVSDSSANISFKPYVVATGALLADTPYEAGIGGGATLHANIGPIALDPFVEAIRDSYRSSGFYPLAAQFTGMLYTYALQAGSPIYGGLSWQARLAFVHADANYEPDSYNRYSLDIAFPLNFSSPWDARVWTVTPAFGVSQWLYAAPDPTVDPFVTQRDLEWRAGVGVDIPIHERFGLGLLLQYRAMSSNIPIFTMRDLSISGGPTFRF